MVLKMQRHDADVHQIFDETGALKYFAFRLSNGKWDAFFSGEGEVRITNMLFNKPKDVLQHLDINRPKRHDYLDDFTQAYFVALLWSSDDVPLDENYDIADIDEDDLYEMIVDCNKFKRENRELLKQAYDMVAEGIAYTPERAGHDFWLSRVGHGTGFWDRGLGEVGEKLTEAAAKFGNIDPIVDDGIVYLH